MDEIREILNNYKYRYIGTTDAVSQLRAREQKAVEAAIEHERATNPAFQIARQNEIVIKLRAEGKSVREIATIMGFKNPGSISWLMKRAKRFDETQATYKGDKS